MNVEFVTCPVCKQKLAVQGYVVVGSNIVCANPNCNTSLRIVKRKPLRAEQVPVEQTFNHDDRPESYG
jgi:uncharacterized protein YbaR (Trm112 family)